MIASDNRAESVIKRARATVTISIVRDSGPPVFRNTPYLTSVPLTEQVNASVFTVIAVDPNLQVKRREGERDRERGKERGRERKRERKREKESERDRERDRQRDTMMIQ